HGMGTRAGRTVTSMDRPSLYRLTPVCGRSCYALLAIVDLEFQVELLRRLRSIWALVLIWHGVVARWSREQKLLAQFSIPRSASLHPFPERTERAVRCRHPCTRFHGSGFGSAPGLRGTGS